MILFPCTQTPEIETETEPQETTALFFYRNFKIVTIEL